jgi:hypothetical protein
MEIGTDARRARRKPNGRKRRTEESGTRYVVALWITRRATMRDKLVLRTAMRGREGEGRPLRSGLDLANGVSEQGEGMGFRTRRVKRYDN